jgi:Pyruvate kinase, barrel domain
LLCLYLFANQQSMIDNPTPTRAEASDVVSTISDSVTISYIDTHFGVISTNASEIFSHGTIFV